MNTIVGGQEDSGSMSVRTRVAVKTLTWTTGFAIVVVLAIVGGHILITTFQEWDHPSGLTRNGHHTGGVVVAQRRSGGGLGRAPMEEIEISFTLPNGQRYDFWEGGHADIGDKVTVRYDPDNPDNASINSAAHDRVGIVANLIAGLALLIGLPFLLFKLAWAAYRRAAKA